ncbi:plasmid mobilization protein [Lichenicoccus roseus]|uniref:Uncharacterized protein n=1 Tax=Lichenicoccus roseus TaxID=2683649 RepID=A0A5R9IZL6_9PROT|nr:hypothetical protein [Lichenicoccus roseus]TLU70894.1 hypothetical protein FE263_20145 [Lichenicoccus roseus]
MYNSAPDPRGERPILLRLTASEHARIAAAAKRHGQPVATFLRNVGTNIRPETVLDAEVSATLKAAQQRAYARRAALYEDA